MIPANSPLPATHKRRFVTLNDGQTSVKVVVFEGAAPDPEDCRRIGECVVSGLPPRPKGQGIEISYRYGADGRLRIEARDQGTGRAAQSKLLRPASLSSAQRAAVADWLEEVCR